MQMFGNPTKRLLHGVRSRILIDAQNPSCILARHEGVHLIKADIVANTGTDSSCLNFSQTWLP